ncbi:hypothetical protein CK203_096080 [Vitis vinifera]|uniref:Uncharacterized protein n=1 Tax=Vitis vinifera TaxID=29760 RepID=A0A438CN38_VITVI|nr:hypothetical protein CK203_096080 [Vitis vinifera]
MEIPTDIRALVPTVPSTGPMPEVASFAPPATLGTPPITLTATQSVLAQQIEGPPLAEQTVPPEETTIGHIEASIPSIQTFTAEPSSPHDPPTTI